MLHDVELFIVSLADDRGCDSVQEFWERVIFLRCTVCATNMTLGPPDREIHIIYAFDLSQQVLLRHYACWQRFAIGTADKTFSIVP